MKTLILLTCAAGLMLSSAGADVTISYLGADTANAATWRSTSVAKNPTLDVDGDNAYGTAGYALVSYTGTPGGSLGVSDWVADLPGFVSLTASSGNRWFHVNYPDIDDPAQPIGPTVADLTAPPTGYNNPTVTFTITSAQDFVFSVLSTHDAQGPGTLTVTGPGGATASHTDTTTLVGMYFFEMKGFQAGDTFTLTATASNGKFSAVAFDAIAAPPTYSIVLASPANNQIFNSTASVSATASVFSGTSPFTVKFYLDSNLVSTTNDAPTTVTVDLGVLSFGSHTLYATATDSTSMTVTSATSTISVETDTTAPTPDPMTFASVPASANATSISMTATTATDALSPPVQYWFENTTNSNNSGWISSTVWTDTGLTAGVTYGYRVKARDAATTPNETAFSAILNGVPVDPTFPVTWDANNTGAGQTDGDGTWLNASQWWDGFANGNWNNSIPNNAVIGNGGAGGTITVGTVTAGSVTFTNFTGSYALSGGSLSQSGGITVAANAGNVTLGTVISGAGGITKAGTGTLTLPANHTYTGATIVNGGTLSLTGTTLNGSGIRGSASINVAAGAMIEATTVLNLLPNTGWTIAGTVKTGNGYLKSQEISGAITLNGGTLTSDTAAGWEWGAYIFSNTTVITTGASTISAVTAAFGGTNTFSPTSASDTLTISSILGIYTYHVNDIYANAYKGSLIKTGAGTVILTGANQYRGTTTVNEGTLAVTGSLGATAVTVNSPATLAGNGNIGGSVTIAPGAHHALAVAATAGTQVTRAITGTLAMDSSILDLTAASTPAAGEYVLATATVAITGTAATINYNGISGGTVSVDTTSTPQRLLLTVGSNPYSTWANGTFANGATLSDKDPDRDPDGDTLTNLQEYAFGTDPTVSSSGEIVVSGASVTPGAPKIVADNGSYYMVFGRRKDYVAAGLTYTVEFTAGLDLWGDNDDNTNPPESMGASDGTVDAMRVLFPPSVHVANGDVKPNFARVRVVLAP